MIDDCGQCLDPNDPNFNRSCLNKFQVYIPNTFSPNGDGVNDRFQVFGKPGIVKKVRKYTIFDRWGNNLFESENFVMSSFSNWWDGTFKGENLQSGVYVYSITIEFMTGDPKNYIGDIMIIN